MLRSSRVFFRRDDDEPRHGRIAIVLAAEPGRRVVHLLRFVLVDLGTRQFHLALHLGEQVFLRAQRPEIVWPLAPVLVGTPPVSGTLSLPSRRLQSISGDGLRMGPTFVGLALSGFTFPSARSVI